jgi:hypothetical protein
MAQQYDAIKAANAAYVAGFGAKGELPMPPARKAAVVICMVRAALCARDGTAGSAAHSCCARACRRCAAHGGMQRGRVAASAVRRALTHRTASLQDARILPAAALGLAEGCVAALRARACGHRTPGRASQPLVRVQPLYHVGPAWRRLRLRPTPLACRTNTSGVHVAR